MGWREWLLGDRFAKVQQDAAHAWSGVRYIREQFDDLKTWSERSRELYGTLLKDKSSAEWASHILEEYEERLNDATKFNGDTQMILQQLETINNRLDALDEIQARLATDVYRKLPRGN